LREGKKLQQVRAVLLDGDIELATLTVLRARLADSAVGPLEHRYPGPDQGEVYRRWDGSNGFEIRMLGERTSTGGRATLWQRASLDIGARTPASRYVRSVALADIAGGMASALDLRTWSFPNIDISVHLFRQ